MGLAAVEARKAVLGDPERVLANPPDQFIGGFGQLVPKVFGHSRIPGCAASRLTKEFDDLLLGRVQVLSWSAHDVILPADRIRSSVCPSPPLIVVCRTHRSGRVVECC